MRRNSSLRLTFPCLDSSIPLDKKRKNGKNKSAHPLRMSENRKRDDPMIPRNKIMKIAGALLLLLIMANPGGATKIVSSGQDSRGVYFDVAPTEKTVVNLGVLSFGGISNVEKTKYLSAGGSTRCRISSVNLVDGETYTCVTGSSGFMGQSHFAYLRYRAIKS